MSQVWRPQLISCARSVSRFSSSPTSSVGTLLRLKSFDAFSDSVRLVVAVSSVAQDAHRTMLRVRPVITAGASRATLRVFSSSCRTHAPVPLAADVYAAPTASASSSAAPLVILHGLYGSKQNWRSLAKSLAQKLERDVHALVRSRRHEPTMPSALSHMSSCTLS